MAILDNKPIRGWLSGVFKYNDAAGKNLPPDGITVAAAYIRGGHSVERLYSRGHNGCSSNPELAIQQFRACEAMYRKKKCGSKEAGLADGKKPIIAEHIFVSFPQNESVQYDTQCEIADKLCSSDILRDFYAVSNRHWNTDNDHRHIIVCNVSKDGSHKLGMNNAKRNALRKELGRICALDYVLSVIDDPALMFYDPDREAFIRSLVDGGKVNVYAPADYKRILKPSREYDRWMLSMIRELRVLVADGVSKNRKCTQEEAYERLIAEKPSFRRWKDKKSVTEKKNVLIKEEDITSRKAIRVYYWDYKYKIGNRYYAVRRYDDYGHQKPMLLLVLELLHVVSTHQPKYSQVKQVTDRKIQGMADVLRYQREYGIRTPD